LKETEKKKQKLLAHRENENKNKTLHE